MGTALPDKLFFKIGEVAELVGVKPHVLRYWETEFAALRPLKTRGSHRMYKRRDVELAMLIRQLLHDDGFTISGARKRIRELRRERTETPAAPESADRAGTERAAREVSLRAELLALRETLVDLLASLEDAGEDDAQTSVTITSVAPSSAAIRRS